MAFYPHGIRKFGSPGFELEQSFYNWLCEHPEYYDKFEWDSYSKKSVFDFFIRTYDSFIYIDCVGYRIQNGRMRLYTSHKDWYEMLDYAKNDTKSSIFKDFKTKCYLAFVGYTWKDEFSFLRITEDLPSSDIFLSKHRVKAIRGADGVFDSVYFKRKRYNDMIKARAEYKKLTKKQEASIDSWIYGDKKA